MRNTKWLHELLLHLEESELPSFAQRSWLQNPVARRLKTSQDLPKGLLGDMIIVTGKDLILCSLGSKAAAHELRTY